MASFTKRGKAWRAQVFKLGVRDTATFDTKLEAVRWAAEREAQIEAGHKARDSHPLRKALERYRDHVSPKKRGARWEQIRLDKFAVDMAAFVDKPIAEVTTDDVAGWRDKRLAEVSNGSVRREMALLRSVFEIARKEWGWVTVNPVRDVAKPESPPHRERVVSESEHDAILAALGYVPGMVPVLGKHKVAIGFLLALETGMRAGELFGLTWDRVHLDNRFVSLPRTKNGDGRQVPLSKAAGELLDLLPRSTGTCLGVTPAVADTLFRKAKAKAGITGLHFHDSRATACTRLARKLDVLDLARMIGHRNPKSLMIYYRATAAEIAARLD